MYSYADIASIHSSSVRAMHSGGLIVDKTLKGHNIGYTRLDGLGAVV